MPTLSGRGAEGQAPWWAAGAMAACGMAPIGAFCLHLFGLGPLPHLALAFLAPAIALGGGLARRWPALGALALRAWALGLLATAPYDAFRLGLVALGWLGPDPIPGIGAALGLEPHWLWGYLWRFLGNGAGMGLAFGALGGRGMGRGLLWGSAICLALLGTLAWSPLGQATLFPLTPGTALAAWVGHLIYGACLGLGMAWATPRPVGKPQAN